jgi:hypothetical protein
MTDRAAYKGWNIGSLWQLADCDDYSEIKGHFIIVSPDGEDELPGNAVFPDEDSATAFAKEHGIALVPLEDRS